MSVEKLNGMFLKHESKGFTTHLNTVLQNLRDGFALGVWAYLSSLHEGWEVQKQQLRDHFQVGQQRIDRALKYLSENGLLVYEQEKLTNGKFGRGFIIVKYGKDFTKDVLVRAKPPQPFSVICRNTKQLKNKELTPSPPHTEKRHRGKVQLRKVVAIKEIQSKKEINKQKTNISCAKELARQIDFDLFKKRYPRKKAAEKARRWWDKLPYGEQVRVLEQLDKQIAHDAQWQNKKYIPYAENYLRYKRYNDEIELEAPNLTKVKSKNTPLHTHSQYVDRSTVTKFDGKLADINVSQDNVKHILKTLRGH